MVVFGADFFMIRIQAIKTLAKFCAGIASLGLLFATASAQTRATTLEHSPDSRGPAELTICSQNLENFGSLADSRTRNPNLTDEGYRDKLFALAKRMAKAQCDIIAVQEVLGRTDEIAETALGELGKALKRLSNRSFKSKVGPTLDKLSHVGFLYAEDRVEMLTHLHYAKVELPKLADKEKPRLFIRAPLEMQFSVKPRQGSAPKTIGLINIHFKSRRGGGGDPAELEWETYRMQMAEAIRRISESRYRQSFSSGEMLFAVLGDRNSHFDTATARILEGTLVLNSFKEGGSCRLSKRGVPLCQGESNQPQKLFSPLTSDPQAKLQPGTHHYKGEYSWLDDILMPAESLRFAWANTESLGDFDSGVIYEPTLASDHALVYTRFNW